MSSHDTPKLKDGFIRITNGIFNAIMAANFTKIELNIMLAIMSKTYGFNRKTDIISIRQIAQMTNLQYQHIGQSLTNLIKNNVITISGSRCNRQLGINKNCTQWTIKTKPSVTETVTPKSKKVSRKTLHQRNGNCYTGVTESVTKVSRIPLQQKTQDKLKDKLKDKELKEARKSEPKIIYPEWLNIELFNSYVKNRVFIKSAMSANAQNLAIRKLKRLIDAGDNQTEIIERAIESNWKGFYPINKTQVQGNGKTRPESRPESNQKPKSGNITENVLNKLDDIAKRDIDKNGISKTLDGTNIKKANRDIPR